MRETLAELAADTPPDDQATGNAARAMPASRHTRAPAPASWRILAARLTVLVFTAFLLLGGAAWAQAPLVIVKLTILKVNDDGDDDDNLSSADFYVAGAFTPNGSPAISFDNEAQRIEGETTIFPNWGFEFPAPGNAGRGQLNLQVLDYDSGLNFGDDKTVDVTLDIDFGSCLITSPGLSQRCGWDITVQQSDTVVFRIEVLFPPSSPGLLVRCLQDPLVPQAGMPVTITMDTLDATGTLKITSELNIEINNTQMHRATAVNQTTYTFTPTDQQFSLRCWARNTVGGNPDAEVADTWRRQVRVGMQPERSIPISVVGPSARSIDIVIIPDRDAVPTIGPAPGAPGLADDVNLQADIRRVLWNGFHTVPFFLANQNRFNFWIARTTADIDGTPSSCTQIVPPEDWDQYAFADSGWIFHTDPHRDCANQALRLYGGRIDVPLTPVHETGHTPFGLADEYCCDGGYFQAEQFPNVYTDLASCIADILNVGGLPGDCRPIGAAAGTWHTSDPITDVMGTERRTFNRLDRRRVNWLLNRCVNTTEGC
jgi:hypothetical protein